MVRFSGHGFSFGVSLLVLGLASSCGVLIGNVKPVTQKAENYKISEPSDNWIGVKNGESAESDHTYQSKKTASIISLNTSCRPSIEYRGRTPSEFSRVLLLGISQVSYKDQKSIKVQNNDAIQTTVEGRLSGELVRIRTIVLRHEDCIFDLMYIARPKNFESELKAFQDFVGSLNINNVN